MAASNYVVIESHPNMGGYWVGTSGNKQKVLEYLKNSDLDYIRAVLELKKNGKDASKKFLKWDSWTSSFSGLNNKSLKQLSKYKSLSEF